jgi:acyl-coenzyme A synthetase/AMP-(fatty) acid ligase
MPLEVSFPLQLLKSVLEDAEPTAVCTKAEFSERLAGSSALPILLDTGWFDRVQEENSQLSPLTNPIQVSLDDMAYTVYSSGTTGKPKGNRMSRLPQLEHSECPLWRFVS